MKRKLIPISKWNEYHDWPPIGGLRHLIFTREKNGFDEVLVRPNRVWLIDEEKFFEWMKRTSYKHPLARKTKDENKQSQYENSDRTFILKRIQQIHKYCDMLSRYFDSKEESLEKNIHLHKNNLIQAENHLKYSINMKDGQENE